MKNLAAIQVPAYLSVSPHKTALSVFSGATPFVQGAPVMGASIGGAQGTHVSRIRTTQVTAGADGTAQGTAARGRPV